MENGLIIEATGKNSTRNSFFENLASTYGPGSYAPGPYGPGAYDPGPLSWGQNLKKPWKSM